MATLILIRHGESEGNRDRVFTPTPEVPITDAGREQVKAAAAWIRARHVPAHIVSSPFRRARQSADILAGEFGLGVRVEPDLRERSYGTLAGQPYTAARGCPGYDPVSYWTWCPPGGGETLVDVAARAGAVVDRIARTTPDRDVIVVSHGAVMMGLWWHVTGSWRQGRVSRNAGIVLVEHARGRYLGAVAVEDGAG
jgi:broad specificity phosphatase PhoE